MTDHLKDKVKALPAKPGVYQMLNASGKVIYVGKARNLKKRVSSYFRSQLGSVKTEALMAKVVDFTVTLTSSENEALLLESNLIKQLRPRYNVLLRDDKSYPYLYLATNQPFPRLDYHRGARKAPGKYFGPYPNAGAVRENLAIIQKLFKIRQCKDTFFRNRTRPCLQYQINRCTAPCVGKVTKDEYAEQIQNVILFLEGKNSQVLANLEARMEQAATSREYEQAASFRDLIVRFRKLTTKQFITQGEGNIDVLGISQQQGQTAISVVYIRAGRMLGHKIYFPNVPAGTELQAALAEFIPQYYLSPLRGEQRIERLVISVSLVEREWIQAALQEQLGYKIILSDRKLEKYKRWQQMADANAKFALSQHVSEKQGVINKLEALQKILRLPNPIERIECFDISHTLGEATVASCVVYGAEGALNKEYRRFNIKDVTAGDDYAAMRQAIVRRYTRIKSGDGVLPDLIIIDGGKGQLRQAVEALEEIQVSGVLLLGVAKGAARKSGAEQLLLPGHDHPIDLEPTHMAFHLIQFIRDEAHRFAITAHRNKRAKTRKESPLEHIEGVGPKRRRDLLNHFGGWREIAKAGVAEIAQVSGISEALAQKIYDALHE